jgi:type I restriction enzyme M protein
MQDVRDWILRWARLKAVVSLPHETFAPYGAGVKTSVVFLEKRERPLSENENDTGMWIRHEYMVGAMGKISTNVNVQNTGVDYQIYMAQVENIGYDATGRLSVTEEDAAAPPNVKDIVKDFGESLGW